jgi:hypothetical protein
MYILVEQFDSETICKKITKDFEVTKIDYKFLNRENNLTDIGGGTIKPSNPNPK